MRRLTFQEVTEVWECVKRAKVTVLGRALTLHSSHLIDASASADDPRRFICYVWVSAYLPCALTGEEAHQRGRDWPVDYADEASVMRTVLLAVERFMLHEAHEGIRLNDRIYFDPHKETDDVAA